MITRLESCTKEAVQGPPSARAATQDRGFESRRARSQVARDVTLVLCTIAYLGLVLFDDVESPLLSLALIALVVYELIQPHLRSQ